MDTTHKIELTHDELNTVIAALHCYYSNMHDEALEWNKYHGNGVNPAATEANQIWLLMDNIEKQTRKQK